MISDFIKDFFSFCILSLLASSHPPCFADNPARGHNHTTRKPIRKLIKHDTRPARWMQAKDTVPEVCVPIRKIRSITAVNVNSPALLSLLFISFGASLARYLLSLTSLKKKDICRLTHTHAQTHTALQHAIHHNLATASDIEGHNALSRIPSGTQTATRVLIPAKLSVGSFFALKTRLCR